MCGVDTLRARKGVPNWELEEDDDSFDQADLTTRRHLETKVEKEGSPTS